MSITCLNTDLRATCWHFLSSKWPHRLKLNQRLLGRPQPTRQPWTVQWWTVKIDQFKALDRVPGTSSVPSILDTNESKMSHFWTGVFFECGLNIWRWRGWHKYLDGLRISYLGWNPEWHDFVKGFDDLKFSIRTLAHPTSNYKLSQVIWGLLRSVKVNPDFQDLKNWYRLTTNWGNEMTTNHKGSFLAPISNALPGAQV